MNIHQLSARYNQEQDRILVRINSTEGTEMRLWLTRRLTLALWPTLNKAVVEHVARQDGGGTHLRDDASKKMLADFQREAVLRDADFSTPYQDIQDAPDTAATLPLGSAPLLVTEVRITPVANGPLKIAFNEQLVGQANGRGFQVELAPPLVHGLVQLLERALHQSAWGEGSDVLGAPPLQASDAPVLADRPKYLN
ncbi:hypothetical protein [Rhodoferax sp.]|uniref:hypothetical protein n=1 Tax=Rhodoferax sp. TaxID=50421 RepID=UPI0025EAF9FF|nr:hypothetical protein [Rhodoferax sp.]